MPVLSRLLPSASDHRIANFSRIYATHRPLVQRGLTTGFVLYVLLAAYQGVAARPPTKDSKNALARDGKPARVAVSIP
jgi:ATP-binding cassette subfamily D (ALD) long-chain fatty acid import protein